MLLSELVCAYIHARNAERPLGRELSRKSAEQLRDCEKLFSRHLTFPAAVHDLTAPNVTAFLLLQLESGLSPWSVRNRRTGLLMLWRFAHRLGLAPPCFGVRPIHCPAVAIDGYDVETMRRLLEAVRELRGVIRKTGIPKAIWWESFLRTDWEVGLRIGDMLTIDAKQFNPDGWLWTAESKTGKAGWRRIRPTTAAAIARCISASALRTRIWPGYNRRNVCRAFTELAKQAGIGGSSKWIRRGGSSECDRLHPGNGWRHLRHSSPMVWEKHYRVDKIVEVNAPLPPEL